MNTNSESKLNKTEPANSELGGVSGNSYTCDCGQKAKMPLCFDCFKKGLERNDSPMLYSTNDITGGFVIKVFLAMFIAGLIAYTLSL